MYTKWISDIEESMDDKAKELYESGKKVRGTAMYVLSGAYGGAVNAALTLGFIAILLGVLEGIGVIKPEEK